MNAGLPLHPRTTLDTVVEIVLSAMLVFAPLAFGATEAWSQQLLLAGSVVLALCVAYRIAVDPPAGRIWKWTLVPIVLFIGFLIFQLIPLPAMVLHILSPAAYQLRTDGSPQSNFSAPISLYPLATEQQLRQLLLPITVYLTVIVFYRSRESAKRLLQWIAVVGLLVAGMGLWQAAVRSQMIYGVFPGVHRNAGPFMNYGHFAQFINLAIGAGIALLLWQVTEGHSRPIANLKGMIRRISNDSLAQLLLAGILLSALAIGVSQSRGGMVSFVVASLCVALIARGSVGRTGVGAAIFLVVPLIVTIILLFGLEMVFDRAGTLKDPIAASNHRIELWSDLLPAVQDFAITGSGLGTHEVVFPVYDRSDIPSIATHAENEYIQLALETGLPGILLFVAFISLIFAAAASALRRRPTNYATLGLLFGLIAALMHSVTDFGQHVPAVAMVTAVFLGLLVAAGSPVSADHPPSRASRARRDLPRLQMAAPAALAIALVAWAMPSIFRADRAESAWNNALRSASRQKETGSNISADAYVSILRDANRALEIEPRHIQRRYQADVWRWSMLAASVSDDASLLADIPELRAICSNLVTDLQTIHRSAPTFGPAVSLAGQIKIAVLDDTSGADDIRRGARLTAWDAEGQFLAICMDIDAGRTVGAETALLRCARLNSGLCPRIIETLIAKLNATDAAITVAGTDRGLLCQVASVLEARNESPELIDRLKRRADDLLTAQADDPAAGIAVLMELGDRERNLANWDRAIGFFRKVLARDYSNATARMRLAECLVATGKTEEAVQEARVCLRFQPGMKEAESFIATASARLPAAD